MSARIQIEGSRYGRLVVMEKIEPSAGATFYKCVCDCGTTKNVRSVSLRKGDTQSCGCLRQEKMADKQTTHGFYGTPTYRSYRAMIIRCTKKSHAQFKDYGGRGISIHPAWIASFECFLADVGIRPAGMTLDREDSNGNYEPNNCKWSTPTEQNRNKRNKSQLNESTK
jgi:hypothetical protein